jgi:hypothetical protein
VEIARKEIEPGASGLHCNPSYSGGRDREDWSLKPAQANSLRDPISKIPNTHTHTHKTKNRADRAAQEEQCLPSKCETLSSNPSTIKKKKKKKNQPREHNQSWLLGFRPEQLDKWRSPLLNQARQGEGHV